jgi:hypothetical protein
MSSHNTLPVLMVVLYWAVFTVDSLVYPYRIWTRNTDCFVPRTQRQQRWAVQDPQADPHNIAAGTADVATTSIQLSGIPLFPPPTTTIDDDHDHDDHYDDAAALIWPIPLGHVPESLRTCSTYRTNPTRLTSLQKCTLTHYQQQLDELSSSSQSNSKWCGFLYNETLGCLAAVTTTSATETTMATDQPSSSTNVVDMIYYRGEFWFRLVEYETRVPFPVATVELLAPLHAMHEMEDTAASAAAGNQPLQKLRDLLLEYSQLQIEKALEPKSPLELSLLKGLGTKIQPQPLQDELLVAQERRAVIEAAPLPHLVDLMPDVVVIGLSNRCALMLETTMESKVQRACAMVQERIDMERARKRANAITDSVDASIKDLKVGPPTLPPWASQIRKHTRLEYFWNVEVGWCSGTVTDNPLFIVDEWILSVQFDDDGSIHRLPLSADDKLRWRPL